MDLIILICTTLIVASTILFYLIFVKLTEHH